MRRRPPVDLFDDAAEQRVGGAQAEEGPGQLVQPVGVLHGSPATVLVVGDGHLMRPQVVAQAPAGLVSIIMIISSTINSIM